MRLQTPSQTIGPFFHMAMLREGMNDLTASAPIGQRIIVEGRVLDGDEMPVADALLEIWQANAAGRYDHPEDTQDQPLDPNFHGFGRVASDAEGRFHFRTIKPGSVGTQADRQAPHINLSIFARGLLKRLVTRTYFADESLNASDPVLSVLTEPARRDTLIARRITSSVEPVYHFDIVLQGLGETVFFEI
ncbi:MAG: protocatechuate 3,4-dioxygenase subunit alpha [Candidatus Binataceae bacterium]